MLFSSRLCRLALIFSTLLFGAGAFCPAKCLCNDNALSVNCSQAGLQSIPILLNPRIRSLTLANNVISIVTADELGFYAQLEYLDLSNNRIGSITPNAFAKLHKLKWLKITSNELTKIGAETFGGLTALEVLHVDNNRLTRLPTAAFSHMALLQVLTLSNNFLEAIAPGAYTGMGELKELHLKNNKLKQIGGQPYRHLGSLKLLDLSFNSIAEVAAGHLANLDAVEILNLSNNEIEKIDEHAFSALKNVRHLRLDGNRLRRMPTLSFRPLSDLQSLHVGANLFEEISTSAFEGLSRLNELVIDNCATLKEIGLNAFSGLFQLETLVLANNPSLSRVHPLSFETDVPLALRRVLAFGNNFTNLPSNLLPWRQLVQLDLSQNFWRCDCDMVWIGLLNVHVAEEEPQTPVPAGHCYAPIDMRGKALATLRPEDFACSQLADVPCIISILLTAIFILCTLILIIVVRYRRRLCAGLFYNGQEKRNTFYERTLIQPPQCEYEKAYKQATLLYGYPSIEQPPAHGLSNVPYELRYGNNYYCTTGERCFGETTLWRLPLPPPPSVVAPCILDKSLNKLPEGVPYTAQR